MTRGLLPAALLTLALSATAGHAAGVRLLAQDAQGVTLQVSTEGWSLGPADEDGRSRVQGLSAAHSLAAPGRALLPAFSALLALPPDAVPSVRVLSEDPEVALENARLAIAGKPVFTDDRGGLGLQPGEEEVAAIADGAWPPEEVVLGTPYGFRGRRLVSIEVRPFRYDAGAARLTSRRTITVRVDFGRAAARAAQLPLGGLVSEDRHVDASLASSVLNFEQAKGWRVAPRASARASSFGAQAAQDFDESQPEVRVRCDSTALYLLPYANLAASGYPAGVPVTEVSVHRHEYAENVSPPYITIEVPCDVQDTNKNGVFDDGDGIWVYVRDWASRSGASNIQRLWGDAEMVYVTRKPAGGLRIPARPGWRGTPGLTPLASYPQRTRFEGNFAQLMQFIGQPTDTNVALYQWTEIVLYYQRPDTLRFEVADLDTSRLAQFTTSWVGRKFSSHFLWGAVKNGLNQVTSVADSVFWVNKLAYTTTTSIRGSALTEGRTNFFRQWGKTYSSPPDPATNSSVGVGLDYFDIEYWRRYRAIRSYAEFNSGDANGEIQIQMDRMFADSIHVYDVTNPENPVRVVLDPARITLSANGLQFVMQDSVAAGVRRRYVAAASNDPFDLNNGPRVPPAGAFQSVTRRSLHASGAGDYLLVVPEAFLPAVQPLVDLRASQGLRVLVAPLESVADEFNGGRHSPAGIQRFVRYAYQNWESRFLMLVGDGTLDPQNFRVTSGTDWIPVLPTPGPVPVSEGYEIIPSDNRYGCLTGNCDPIFGGGDVVPEIMVGRLPVNSLTEAQTTIAKLVGYESLTGDLSWRRRVLLHADDAFSGETFFGGGSTGSNYCRRSYEERFRTLNEKISSLILRDAGLAQMNVELFNDRYYEANEPFIYAPPADTCRPDRAATQTRVHANVTPILFSRLNAGVLWWNYQGHANEFVLTHEDVYRNVGSAGSDDRNLFTNDYKLNVFSAFSCHANMFARPENQLNPSQGPSIGEDLVTLPNRGSVASWASVCYEVVPRDDSSHVNVELARKLFVDPPRDPVLSERGSRVVLGEAILATLLQYLPTVSSYSYERGLAISYTLLGDPATRLSIGAPQTIVTANTEAVTDGQPVRLHALGNDLALTADLVSTVRLDSLGLYEVTAAGTVPVAASSYSLSPAFPDTASGSVYGGRRFRLTYSAPLRAETYRYVLRTRDRDGLESSFTVLLQLDGILRVRDVPIQDGDDVAPNAQLSMLVLSPRPLDPGTEIALSVNGASQAFTAEPAPGDASGREWVLRWNHDPYPLDDYQVLLTVAGGATVTRRFKVSTASGELKLANLFAFPNPFGNDGTYFSFQLLGSDDADIRVSIFTLSGKVIRSDVVRGLSPGYHQLPWDAKDAEGSDIANGVYLYRLTAVTAGGAKVEQTGRLVKLRRPRRVEEPVLP